MEKFSYLKSSNADYIDELLGRYLQNPESVDESWKYFFEGLELGSALAPAEEAVTASGMDLLSEAKVAELIQAYREYGHLIAKVNPLQDAPASHPYLELSTYGLTQADLEKTFAAGKLIGLGATKLSEIIAHLKRTYCGSIGIELTHIRDRAMRDWTQKAIESKPTTLDPATRKQILKRLSESEGFERFLHTRYVAQKRFSVEGGESIIPSLDCMVETGADLGMQEMVIGMAHRGRLNVLTLFMAKKPEMIMTEFEGNYRLDTAYGEGDVKYHKGYSHDVTTRNGKKVHLSLAFNPSHLEFVNPVVEGSARARQDRRGDAERSQVIPVLIHGDAAFAGQGVCYETIGMCKLTGYSTGGTIHVVINNQVGFTTSPHQTRSTPYSTDLARTLDSPIFHVNGDDPDAVWAITKLATEFRQKFKMDVFIDLVCYRKHGHNEGDEPSFTQPLLYKKIKAHASTREIYAQKLAQAGVVSEAESTAIVTEITEKLTAAQTIAKKDKPEPKVSTLEGYWKELKQPTDSEIFAPAKTAVSAQTLKSIGEKINTIPQSFQLHSKLARFFDARLKAIQDGKGIDWGNGEALAYASLISEGHPVRITGQDAERGTFTHRHSMLHDFETDQLYSPINQASNGNARYTVHNSHLSETAVMGYEYGYSLTDPGTLVIWEAQFGDFANGAQVIIDQFIATSESKWNRMSGLVLLLPHGYEGQGPEHSSARLERFLTLCGRNNIIVANLTTPAQIFHALRRQVLRPFRKPMVVMSPKSLLRHPQAISSLAEFSDGGFQEVINDPEILVDAEAKKIKRILLCTGKVYYDLVAERAARKRSDVAIIRVEQLYPFPAGKLAQAINSYTNAKDVVWVQEEPRNMGAWPFIFGTWSGGLDEFSKQVSDRSIRYAGRGIAASPAVGAQKLHELEQKQFLDQAFAERGKE